MIKLHQGDSKPQHPPTPPTLVPLPKSYMVLNTVLFHQHFYDYLMKIGLRHRDWLLTIDQNAIDACSCVKIKCTRNRIRVRSILKKNALIISGLFLVRPQQWCQGSVIHDFATSRAQDDRRSPHPPITKRILPTIQPSLLIIGNLFKCLDSEFTQPIPLSEHKKTKNQSHTIHSSSTTPNHGPLPPCFTIDDQSQ